VRGAVSGPVWLADDETRESCIGTRRHSHRRLGLARRAV